MARACAADNRLANPNTAWNRKSQAKKLKINENMKEYCGSNHPMTARTVNTIVKAEQAMANALRVQNELIEIATGSP